MPMKLIETVCVPMVLTNSNDGQGHGWYRTDQQKKKCLKILEDNWLADRTPFDHCVGLKIIRVLGPKQRLWDFDSIGRGNAKQLIDAMVELGWFHDDKPEHIRPVHYDQDDMQRENGPCVIVKIYKEV